MKNKVDISDSNVMVRITLRKGLKRSWEIVRKILKKDGRYKVDFRKSSKTCIPLVISCGTCKTGLDIRKVKDFPLTDRKCKCGKFFIRWEWEQKQHVKK